MKPVCPTPSETARARRNRGPSGEPNPSRRHRFPTGPASLPSREAAFPGEATHRRTAASPSHRRIARRDRRVRLGARANARFRPVGARVAVAVRAGFAASVGVPGPVPSRRHRSSARRSAGRLASESRKKAQGGSKPRAPASRRVAGRGRPRRSGPKGRSPCRCSCSQSNALSSRPSVAANLPGSFFSRCERGNQAGRPARWRSKDSSVRATQVRADSEVVADPGLQGELARPIEDQRQGSDERLGERGIVEHRCDRGWMSRTFDPCDRQPWLRLASFYRSPTAKLTAPLSTQAVKKACVRRSNSTLQPSKREGKREGAREPRCYARASDPCTVSASMKSWKRLRVRGFGAVWKAFDPHIKRTVAVKTCTSDDQEVRDRFFQEAEIAATSSTAMSSRSMTSASRRGCPTWSRSS